jgi:ABC-type uncharacterized transport system permease subunit
VSGADIVLGGLLVSALRGAAPLLMALLGECLTQRVGRINLGVEGQMLVGAIAGYATTAVLGDPWLGLLGGALAGAALSLVFAWLVVWARADPFASGLAVLMLGYGLSAYVGTAFVGVRIEGFAIEAGGLTPTTVLALALVPLTALALYHTGIGLRWRAVGESEASARALGIDPLRWVIGGIVVGGLLSGLGGAALSIDMTRTWAEGMTAGRGLVAVGLVIVARWNPWLCLPAALLFGLGEALALRLQAADAAVSAHLLHMLPYAASLLVFTLTCVSLRRHPTAGGTPAGLRAVFDR